VRTAEFDFMTADEFWEWACLPENDDRYWELIEGRPVEYFAGSLAHGVVCATASHLLWGHLIERRRGYICCNRTALLVGRDPDTILGPDLMVFDKNARLEVMSRRYADDVPALVIEVVSPDDSAEGMDRRVDLFRSRGVPLVWLIDVVRRAITVVSAAGGRQELQRSDELTGGEVLPDFRGRVVEFFTLPGQPT
jgi:Uma2 family endonuclease